MKLLGIACLVSLIVTVVGCGGGSSDGTGGQGGTTVPPTISDPTGGDQYGSGPDPIPESTGNPTTENVIDAAFTAGTLTKEQALLYKLYAAFGDTRLPTVYQGDDTGVMESTSIAQVKAYVDEVGIDAIPVDIADQFRRFFAPPYVQGSWWTQQHPTVAANLPARTHIQAGASVDPNCRFWEPVANCPFDKRWKLLSGKLVNVWHLDDAKAVEGARKAALLVAEFDNAVIPTLTRVMGHPALTVPENAGRIDVLLVDLPQHVEGATSPTTVVLGDLGFQRAVPTRIYLSRSLEDRGLIAQSAHEYMHAIQFSYNVAKRSIIEYLALYDATAVWATQYVFPLNNWEHQYPQSYLQRTQFSLDHIPSPGEPNFRDEFRYGIYLFPLFLQSKFKSPTIIRELWERAQFLPADDLSIYDDVLRGHHDSSFEKIWPEFVAAAWNLDGLNYFDKLDGIKSSPADPAANGLTEDRNFLMLSAGFARQEFFWDTAHLSQGKLPAGLPHASSRYYRLRIQDPTARSFTFANGVTFKLNVGSGIPGITVNGLTPEGLSLDDRAGAAVQVYLKVNGVWQYAAINLTNTPWAGICRDDPANLIEEMIVMFSNAQVRPNTGTNYVSLDPREKPPQVYATDIGCRDWTATANLARNSPDGQRETLVMGLAIFKNLASSFTLAPGSEPATYPTGAAGVNYFPINPGNFYSVQGVANWTYAPTPGSCYAGNSKQINLGQFPTGPFLTNWMVDSPALERGISIPGLFADATGLPPTMELPIIPSPDCKGPPTQTVSLGIGLGTGPENSAVRVGPGGLNITSPVSAVSGAGVTGSWTMSGSTH